MRNRHENSIFSDVGYMEFFQVEFSLEFGFDKRTSHVRDEKIEIVLLKRNKMYERRKVILQNHFRV